MKDLGFEIKNENLKVLYVEDEASIREAVFELLSRRMGKIFLASNGREGLEIFEKENPDIVITDIRMPLMNGLEMVRNIKLQNQKTKFIITSAHSDATYFIEAISIGVDEFVLKPISRDKLIEAISKTAESISMQKKLDKQWETISKLYGAIEQSQSLIIITDNSKNIEYVNPRFLKETAYNSEEILVENSRISFELLCDLSNNPRLKKTLETSGNWRGEFSIKHKSGDKIWLFGSLTPVYDSNHQITSFVLVGEDISEIKQMAATLADREDKLRNLIEKLGEGIAIIDLTYYFVFCNQAMTEIFESDELLEKNLSEFILSADEMQNIMKLTRKLKLGEKVQVELPVRTTKNNKKHLSATLTPQLDEKGQGVTGLFCIFKDITRISELIEEIKAARDAAERAYQTIEEKNIELNEANEKLMNSENRLSELNEILMEYIKATGK